MAKLLRKIVSVNGRLFAVDKESANGGDPVLAPAGEILFGNVGGDGVTSSPGLTLDITGQVINSSFLNYTVYSAAVDEANPEAADFEINIPAGSNSPGDAVVVFVEGASLGEGSTIGTHNGIVINNQGAVGVGDAYGIRIADQGGASGGNYSIFTGIGAVHLGDFIESPEISDPAAPAANTGRLYFKDVGGKTAFVARFPSGAVQQIAIEP